ncbi:MAG TPA: inositol monophosphatase family protein [Candidatus Saccharimonadales bacterium]|nr:inositol monophosphatase family protein [Candidatus Saccharimonadales bacterium]
MTPTLDFLQQANDHIHKLLLELQPVLLEAQGKIGHQLKDDKSAVTAMDTMVEDRLRAALHDFAPAIPFSGEESGVDYSQPTYWLVDPIDGTEPFIRDLPFATNMIALVDNNQPVLGIIYNFGLNDYYLAIKGQGATRNGHTIHVSNRTIDRSFLSIGLSNLDVPEGRNITDRIRSELGINSSVKFAATGAEMASVAAGSIEGRVLYKGRAKPWDFAPGALLIQEAGGRVANIGSDAYDVRDANVVATNAVIFDEVMAFMNKIAAPAQ